MKISECKHIRIRDSNAYDINVEEFIKSIEKQYKIDFRSLPGWKDLVQRLHVMTSDCKRIIEDSNRRKYVMISKILIETTRDSPFQLTEKLARTSNKWRALEHTRKKPHKDLLKTKLEAQLSPRITEELRDEISENSSVGHQNTEVFVPEVVESKLSHKSDGDTETEGLASHVPISICTNQHKRLSPVRSPVKIAYEYITVPKEAETIAEKEPKESLLINQTTSVKCFPEEIIISDKINKDQTIQFSIINCTTEHINIRFMCVTDESHFKRTKINPATPQKLYPGIAVTFKFIFTIQSCENFSSMLYFRVGKSVFEEAPVETLFVPIVGKLILPRSVTVSKSVNIAPSYLWHIRKDIGFPTGTLITSINDNNPYHVYVKKQMSNICRELQDSYASIDVISPDTESLLDRIEDSEIQTQSKILTPMSKTPTKEEESMKITDLIALVVEDIVDVALDTFVFDRTYLYLEPHSKKTVKVYFTKPERIGSHNEYYDFEFRDVTTGEVIVTKIVKVFADVLPHPIEIYPRILDMSKSPVTHGVCEDVIVINNTHKVHNVYVKFKLTTKMKKLFCITPMESLVPAQSKVMFMVRLCSKDCLSKEKDDFVHFTFKITVSGHKSVYEKVPPFFYEIIAPCASEFKKLYSEKFCKDE